MRQLAVISGPARGAAPEVLELPGLAVRFLEGGPATLLSGRTISAAAQVPTRREFIDRLFSLRLLDSLRLDPKKGEVRLEFAASKTSRSGIVASLAKAIGGNRPPALTLPHEEAILGGEERPFGVYRAGPALTLWQVEAPSTRYFRLTHPLLRLEYIRKKILGELATLAEVSPRTIYLPLLGSASLLVFVRPHRVDPALFREALDPVLTRCLSGAKPRPLPSPRDVLVNANLGLALASDFLFPPLGAANVAATALFAAGYLPRALAGLRQRKFTLEVLYLAIASLAVITYDFLPTALMYWLMRFWARRARGLYDSHHSRLVARYRLRPRRIWIDQGETSLETRVEELTPSSVVALGAGDIVPGDGIVVDGAAEIDERWLTGARESVPKINGDKIYAASRVVEGSLRMKIKTLGEDTAAGRLARWHSEAPRRRVSESPAMQRADKTVLPVLAAGAIAAAQGGLPLARTVLGPDYLTGPALSEDLDALAAIMRAASSGILIARNSPLEKLGGPVCVIFDDTIPWQTPETVEGTFAEIALKQGVEEVVFFSKRSQEETARLAARLGFATFQAESSQVAKRAYIERRQGEGRTVVFVGDCAAERAVAKKADLAVTVLAPPFDRLEKGTIALLSPDLLKFLELRAIAADLAAHIETAFHVALAPNVAAVLAAFFLTPPRFTSLVLTNLGTLANYIRSETVLHLAQSSADE